MRERLFGCTFREISASFRLHQKFFTAQAEGLAETNSLNQYYFSRGAVAASFSFRHIFLIFCLKNLRRLKPAPTLKFQIFSKVLVAATFRLREVFCRLKVLWLPQKNQFAKNLG